MLAPNGCAAVNIEGETIHSAARVFCKGVGASALTKERLQDACREVNLVALEAKSVIGGNLFGQ